MSDAYLPEHAPIPEPPKSNAKKTVFLWVCLILLFLVIWQLLTPAERGPAPAPPQCVAPCVEPSGPWTSILTTVLPLAFVVLMVVLFVRRFRASSHFNAEQEPAFRAIAQRRFAEATKLLLSLRAKYEGQPMYRAVVDLGIADAELWAGNFDAAIASCVAVDKISTLSAGAGARVVAAADLAFAHALAGDQAAAQRWRDEGRARLTKTADARMINAAKLRLAEAVLACRRGAAKEAVALLEEAWLEMRFSFNANWMRVAEVIRAFAEAQGDLREQNVVAARLVRIEPVVGEELGFLGRKWPEMHAFLSAHGLSRHGS